MARERWGSRLGVIMAVAGSAVGLGNFLRFPGMAATNGGGAFLIPYFIALVLLGLPLMWIEWTIGRFGGGFGHSTAPGMFHSLAEKNRFIKYFGVIGIFGPILIFVWYIYVESWLLGYSFFALFGKYSGCHTYEGMKRFLAGYTGQEANEYFDSILPAYGFFLITFLLNIMVVYFGIRRGIERVCKWGLPILFVLAIVLAVRVFTLGSPHPDRPDWNVLNGLGFLWNPDWSKLGDAKVWLAAAGQIFFTLSVGIGVILTYASYLTREDDVALSGLTAASANEMAEVILGASIVIPAAFAFFGPVATTQAAGSSVVLGFQTTPVILQQLPLGHVLGFMWFALLFIAGFTSSISLMLPAVAFLEDEFGVSRRTAVLIFAIVTFDACQGVIFGHGVLGDMDAWSNFFLVLFGTIEVILFAWVFGMDRAWTELHVGSDITIPGVYRFIIKYVTPLVLLVILGGWVWQQGIQTVTMQDSQPEEVRDILVSRIRLALLLAVLAFLVWKAWKRRGSAPA